MSRNASCSDCVVSVSSDVGSGSINAIASKHKRSRRFIRHSLYFAFSIKARGQRRVARTMVKSAAAPKKSDPLLKRAGVKKYNQPRATPGEKKSHVVVAKQNGKTKIIRFGQPGVKTNQSAEQRRRFLERHRKNIEKAMASKEPKLHPIWWAKHTKWNPKK